MADLKSQNEGANILRNLPERDWKALKELLKGLVDDAVREQIPGTGRGLADTTIRELGYTDAVAESVREIKARTGDAKEDVLLKALVLYEAALDAQGKGNRLAVLNPDDEIVREIRGLPAPSRNPSPVELGSS